MDDVRYNRLAQPHHAKLVALGSAVGLVLALMMPFATGPMGMVVSGWRALDGTAGLMVGLVVVAVMCGLFGLYLFVTGVGVIAAIILMGVSSRISQAASAMMTPEQGDLAATMTGLMAAQVGLSWGAMLSFLCCLLLCCTPLFYRRPLLRKT